MTKKSEPSPIHTEKLMVAVRVRPMNFRDGQRTVNVIGPQGSQGHVTQCKICKMYKEFISSIFNAFKATNPCHHQTLLLSEVGTPIGDPELINASLAKSNRTSVGPIPTNNSKIPANNRIISSAYRHNPNNIGSSNNNPINFHGKYSPPSEGKIYDFDRVFDEHVSQDEVYRFTTAPLIRSVFQGFCATVFAYGATGSGKTFTMGTLGTGYNDGIMARSADDIFQLCSRQPKENKTEVYLSYLEVYNEQIRDLLKPNQGTHLELREDKEQVHVAGLSEVKTSSTREVINLLEKGNKARTMEATGANEYSSRSHAILLVTVKQILNDSGQVTDGKLYLIDLAGSERASNTKNSGQRLREGGHINRSLLALGNCITALASGDSEKYINYRDSKLTRLLKAALGGPSKTVMIAHISAGSQNREETRNTLLYAQRARAISNKVRRFVYHPAQGGDTASIIQELRDEVKRLQKKLNARLNSVSPVPGTVGFGGLLNDERNVGLSSVPFHSSNQDIYIVKQERPELSSMKKDITSLFDQEFKLRNELLKYDGAMLQSALDCEVLRLMVLDWESLNGKDEDGGAESASEIGKSEIQTVMAELKEVRDEQDRLIQTRVDIEQELQEVRRKINLVEEEAIQYIPEVQRVILSLLCKLQQEQLNKMSVEIESELKRRGALLLRCLRQRALGEAIIHRQRHFLQTVPVSPNYNGVGGRNLLSRDRIMTASSNFLPPLARSGMSARGRENFQYYYSPPDSRQTPSTARLPPLHSSSPANGLVPIPNTTKYVDFRNDRENSYGSFVNHEHLNQSITHQAMSSSEEEDSDDQRLRRSIDHRRRASFSSSRMSPLGDEYHRSY